MDKELVHFYPFLCAMSDRPMKIGESITATKDINGVTCPKCSYYYFHPEAKALEEAWRRRK